MLAALAVAAPAWAQDPTPVPTETPIPTATPTPTPTPTPEEIEEAERKEKLRKRMVVRRVYRDFRRDGRIDNCDHSRTALKRTLESITDEFDADFPDFRAAVRAAIKDHDKERCEPPEPEPTPAPTTPAPTSTPAPPPPRLAPRRRRWTTAGSTSATTTTAAAPRRRRRTTTRRRRRSSDVTPVQPTATPPPAVTPPPAAEPQLAVVQPAGDPNLTVPALLLAIALLGLALLAASVLAARRGRLAGWGHAWREASYRAAGAWGDFGDWLRLGRVDISGVVSADCRPMAFRPTRAEPSSAPTRFLRPAPQGAAEGVRMTMEQTPQTTLTKDPRSGEALTVRRLFTQAGVHPFDTVEWETRTAAVGSFRQDGVEFPSTWSQNATNIVAQKYFRGQLDSPDARALGQADDRPRVRHDRRLGA